MDLMITEGNIADLGGNGIAESKVTAGTYGHTYSFAETICCDDVFQTIPHKRQCILNSMELTPTEQENTVIARNSESMAQTNTGKNSITNALTFPPVCRTIEYNDLGTDFSFIPVEARSTQYASLEEENIAINRYFKQALVRWYHPRRKIGKAGLDMRAFTSVEMRQIVGNFINKNFLGFTHMEELYKGKIQSEDKVVVVKMCNFERTRYGTNIDWISRIIDEMNFLKDPTIRGHPNLVEMIGYCEEGREIGVVYDIDPLGTLSNVILEGHLNWTQTWNIALKLAELLEFLHSKGYLVRNLAPAHIIIDTYLTPRLVDFMFLTGGLMGDRMSKEKGTYLVEGYEVPRSYSVGYDVFLYGIILVNLIAKRCYHQDDSDIFYAHDWAEETYYKHGVRSLVHESMKKDTDNQTGEKITSLAMRCLEKEEGVRPTMKQVVAVLKKCKVFGN